MSTPPAYAELHCLSSFSFQRGASQPEELVARAHALGYTALAITDECSVAGVVRAHEEAQAKGLHLVLGSEFRVALPRGGAFTLVALVHTLQGWGSLCAFITHARMAAPKGLYHLTWADVQQHSLADCELLLSGLDALSMETAFAVCCGVQALYGAQVWLAVTQGLGGGDALRGHRVQQLARLTGLPQVATGHVHMHVRSRKPLHDVLTAVRVGLPVAQCGFALQANAELHLRSRARLAALYAPELLAATVAIAARCTFSLTELRYQYPMEAVLPGHTPAQTLRQHVQDGARVRYPDGTPPKVQTQIEHELALIAEKQYEMYFLTVHDLVRFARGRGILCQGRGSAANSVVCYCLGVTEVDPARMQMLFERFISRERDEPPDIDVDFEHQRREEVIQYIYQKYGRERAAITAVVAHYRPRSALRDVGRALDIPEALITAMAKEHPGMYSRTVLVERLDSAIARVQAQAPSAPAVDAAAAGRPGPTPVPPARAPRLLLPTPRRLQLWLSLACELQRFPRHLSQHVGGFVLTQGLLTRVVPVENASMKDRSVIQWDKDDLDAVGLLKVDVLALGMLSAIRRCLLLIEQARGTPMRMQDIPAEDPAVYAMISRADTVGVFQIESRAQMSMLPRLKPQTFYDLVVEVAIVRPGPIQGGMVHPYLQARAHPEAVTYASPALKEVLKRTHGVPIFQEQVMQVAMAAADFSAGESDQLRRSMAAWKRKGGVHKFYDRLVGGMLKNGYTQEYADQLFKQIEGFGEYGFPESHAASFALLVYASCWLKWYEPACFLAAMLNSQPLGFYGPAQLVQDAQRHGVEVRAVDVQHSDWDCTLEDVSPHAPPLREGRWSCPGLRPEPFVPSEPAQAGSEPRHSAPGGRIFPWGGPAEKQSPHTPPLREGRCPQPAVRLGLRMVKGLAKAAAERIVAARSSAPFASTQDLALRCQLDVGDLRALASADALQSLSGHRRQQVWDASALRAAPALLQGVPVAEDALQLQAAEEGEEVVFDYASVGLSLRSHPLALLREQLAPQRFLTSAQMHHYPSGRLVRACGIVTMRQQPQTAKGVVFVTLEDETGSVNVTVWKAVKEQFREVVYRARLMAVYGVWQRDVAEDGSPGEVRHVVAKRLVDLTHLLGSLSTVSRDFH
jgi:error-prone DNA polymerase